MKPDVLEDRIKICIKAFLKYIVKITGYMIEMEATVIVLKLIRNDMKLLDEIGTVWGDIFSTEVLSKK